MANQSCDILILGGGMVGLSLANQLIERNITTNIIIIDKENELGLHSSGRNSGVLHAGLYYKPGSVKAKVCVDGARRLRAWVEERGLPINACGKVIVPQRKDLDKQLDILAERGKKNGATVEIWDSKRLNKMVPEAKTASDRALWSPNTVVVKPKTIIKHLKNELKEMGVKIKLNGGDIKIVPEGKRILLTDGSYVSYKHLFNCAGLQADRVAKQFGIGNEYYLLPFKGLYWELKRSCPIRPTTNIYPVPDLDIPFLGVHFTPSADQSPVITIGPTATPAWGRENYKGIQALELETAAINLRTIGKQYLKNKGGFRKYVHEQAFLGLPNFLIDAARQLVPGINLSHIKLSDKVGIRAQLYNRTTESIQDDFLCLSGSGSTHILNAISPAFTASFALADLILDQAQDSIRIS